MELIQTHDRGFGSFIIWGENDKLVLDFLLNKGYTVYRSLIGNKEDCCAFKNIEKHQKVKEVLNNIEVI